MNNCYVLTGAPGSGKTAILRELADLGFIGIAEPAREVLARQRAVNGDGVPEKDPRLFCSLMLSIAVAQLWRMSGSGAPVFFDRGIPDIIAYARWFGIDASAPESAARMHRYNELVFMTRTWSAIYATDEERTMTLEAARSFGDQFHAVYSTLGYRVVDVPLGSPRERAEFMVKTVMEQQSA